MRTYLRMAVASALVTLFSLAAAAQAPAAINQDRIKALRPPIGAKVAIIVFEDLQCPDCARAHPLVKQVAEQQKVPIVLHDFPLPMHNFAKPAAIYARYFDTKSAKLGGAFRDFIFQNQASITGDNFKQYVDRFVKENGTTLPFLLDPGKRLETKVDTDVALGKKIGIQHTPTIFVVGSSKTMAEPFVEVVDRTKLSQMIQDMKNAK